MAKATKTVKDTKILVSAAAKKQLTAKAVGRVSYFAEENGPTFVEWSQKQKGSKIPDIVLETNLVNIKKASVKARGK